MEFLSGLTDDQTALIGCVVALAACGLALTLSSFIGQARNRTQPATRPLSEAARRTPAGEPPRRKAA